MVSASSSKPCRKLVVFDVVSFGMTQFTMGQAYIIMSIIAWRPYAGQLCIVMWREDGIQADVIIILDPKFNIYTFKF